MPKFIDLTDQVFGRLTVKCREKSDKKGDARWKCVCICGNITIVRGYSLKSKDTQSCGCLQKEVAKKNKFIHGMKYCSEYKIWGNIKQRCNNPNSPNFKRYGNRGITICEKWCNSFTAFFNDMGNRPSPEHTIERIDNNKGYSPDNCKWATPREQANNRRNNHFITLYGRTLTIAQWSRLVNIRQSIIRDRIYEGWPPSKAVFKPVQHRSVAQV